MTRSTRERLRFSHIAVEEEVSASFVDFNLTLYEGETCILTGRWKTKEHSIIRIMRGDIKIDSGEIYLNEKRVHQVDQSLLVDEKIYLVGGKKDLAQGLSVAENLILLRPRQKNSFFLRASTLDLEAREVLDSLGLIMNVNETVNQFSTFDQILISLARGVARQAHLFMLDLTCDSFKADEYRKLQRLLAKLQAKGATLLIIDNTPDYWLDLADKIVITHEGRDCKTLFCGPDHANSESRLQLAFKELGMSFALEDQKLQADSTPSLPAKNALSAVTGQGEVLFSLNPGEILCFSETVHPDEVDTYQYIHRFLKKNELTFQIDGKILDTKNRKIASFIPDISRDLFHKNLPLSDLILLPRYNAVAKPWGLVSNALNEIARREFCLGYCENEDARTIDDLSHVERRLLSIYRFAMIKPKMIVIDDPTRGLDALDRIKILDYLRRLSEEGTFVLLTQYAFSGEHVLCAKTIHTADGIWLGKRSDE